VAPIDRPHQVHGALWSPVTPTPVGAPKLLLGVREVAELVGLSMEELASPAWVEALAGNRVLDGMSPYAACYGGHQFGHWAGQLGDGRAITLGEVVHAGRRWELQLKGAGLTPYSRTADGRAVLRSSIRELLCSEAMHHLGVPTTRALSLVATGESVMRDMFYDGNACAEPGAIVCRVAPSFIRFGNFELPAAREDRALLTRLVDFTIARDFPHLAASPESERRTRWFVEVCERTAWMVAEWMRVGFVHGVMNTDNMSILGLTIDYGPYGWIDDYDPNFTPNTTDASGRRYRFAHQPAIAKWNLERLASALMPLYPSSQPLEVGLDRYVTALNQRHAELTAHKLGFARLEEDDEPLVGDLFGLMAELEIDMTIFFRRLADVSLDAPSSSPLREAFYDPHKLARAPELEAWLLRWAARARRDDDPGRRARMNAGNPRYVLRNYLAHEVIDAAAAGDAAPMAALLEVLRRPYDEQPTQARFAAKRPEWARHRPGCSMLSCSS
jgi:uncharacterized protein YdiU (UPF0061 family)